MNAQVLITSTSASSALEAISILFQQPVTAQAVLARHTLLDEPEILAETIDVQHGRTSRDMLPSAAGLRAALDEVARNNPKAIGADPQAFVDLEPLQRLIDTEALRALGIDPGARGETLSIAQFVAIANAVALAQPV